MERRRTRSAGPLTALVFGALALAGCAAEVAPANTPDGGTEAPSPVATTPSPTPSAAEYAVPPVEDGELARAVFEAAGGPDGTPITTLTAVDALGADQTFRVEGDCDGRSVGFSLVTAAVGASGDVLVEGSVRCDEPSDAFTYTVPYTGVVQLRMTDTGDSTEAWVRAIVTG